MLFTSYEFIFMFLPIVVIVYFILSKFNSLLPQQVYLITASLFFYGYSNPVFILIILISIIFNYSIANFINLQKKQVSKILFLVGILVNLGMLVSLKYTNFIGEIFNFDLSKTIPLLNSLLPIGIGIFTLGQISFLIRVYQKRTIGGSFLDYCLFITFFPQLIAGPIGLYDEMIMQYKELTRRYMNYDNIAKGIYIFILGLFKKTVIADTLFIYVNNGYNLTNLGMLPAWITTISYTFYIYFTFSGYCDMAIGIGKVFNIDLPINFNSPYKAKSITEFWKRWNITLGRILENYVYIPLGNNQKGNVRTNIYIMFIFITGSFWYGASVGVVLWGFFHGMFTIMERSLDKYRGRIPRVVQTTVTFLLVNFLWVLFRAKNLSMAFQVYKGMFNYKNLGGNQIIHVIREGGIYLPSSISSAYFIVTIGFCFLACFFCENTVDKSKKLSYTISSAIYTAFLFFVGVIHMTRIGLL